MSAGKKYKFQGSTIQFLADYAGGSPSPSITAITKANPAVVTSAGHGLVDGDVIRIQDVVGMIDVNGGTYIVDISDANTFSLLDTNSSGYGTYTSGGHFDKADFSNFCELTDYNRQGGTSPEIPTTTVCSTAAEFVLGLPDFGTTQISYNFAPLTSTVQGLLHAAYLAGTTMAVKVTLPNSGGSMTLLGFIQKEDEQASVNGLWKGSTTIRNTGNRADFS